MKAAVQRMEQAANRIGLPMATRTMTYNSRLAQELAKWAESQGKGDQYHKAVFKAYYVEGRNIGKEDELVGLAESIGLSGVEARSILKDRKFRRAVDNDWARSRELLITGVPTFVMNNRSVVGAQPYEVLEEFIKAGGAKRRDTGEEGE